MNLGELWETAEDRGTWHGAVHGGVTKSQTQLSNWTAAAVQMNMRAGVDSLLIQIEAFLFF